MDSKLPAFQFYPGDWRKDIGVQSLSYHDRGVWHEIFCLMHDSEQRGLLLLNGKPMPTEVLARILGLDKQSLERTLETLISFGVAAKDERSGALMCEWMVKGEHLRQIRKESGKKGGNPNLVNQNSTKQATKTPTKPESEVNQNSTPSSSSSSSSLKRTTIVVPKNKGCRIPENFTVSAEMRAWASKNTPGVAVEFEFGKFVDYYKSATGKNAVGLDWTAKWRTWMNNAYTKFGTVQPTPQVEPSSEETDFAKQYAAAEAEFYAGLSRPMPTIKSNGVN